MKATVTKCSKEEHRIEVRVRRGHKNERVDLFRASHLLDVLKVGDFVCVERRKNSPYINIVSDDREEE